MSTNSLLRFWFSWLPHYSRTQWLRSQLIHVKLHLNASCKQPIEVFIQLHHHVHILTPRRFLFWTNHRLHCHVLAPTHWRWAAWQQTHIDALRLSVYVCPCQGRQRSFLHGWGWDTNQAELSWDSMSAAGSFQAASQAATDWWGGAAVFLGTTGRAVPERKRSAICWAAIMLIVRAAVDNFDWTLKLEREVEVALATVRNEMMLRCSIMASHCRIDALQMCWWGLLWQMNIPLHWHAEIGNGALHQFRMWVTHIKSSMYDCSFTQWCRTSVLIPFILRFIKYLYSFHFFSLRSLSEDEYLTSKAECVGVS